MTKEEAIKHGKEQLEIFWGKNREFAEVATRSLEAWDDVLKELEQTVGNIVYTRWCADLIKKHLKEVETNEDRNSCQETV